MDRNAADRDAFAGNILRRPAVGVLLALAACGAVTLLAWPLSATLHPANTVMVYLLAVALVAMAFGHAPAVVAAVASVMLFDFFFVEPRLSFAVADAQYLVTFAVMLAVGLIVATLTARLRDEARRAAEREARAHALCRLAHEIAGVRDVDALAACIGAFVATEFGTRSTLWLVSATDGAEPVGAGDSVSSRERAIVHAVLDHGRALPFVDTEGAAACLALPLDAPVRRRGVLVVRAPDRDVAVAGDRRPLLDAVAALASTAVERMHFVDVARTTQVAIESERLRGAVLSAVSHDLRTPLTVIVGLADELARSTPPLPSESERLATELRDQAARLCGMVENLLDLARLRAGRVEPRKAWQPLEEVVGSAVRAAEAVRPDRPVAIDLAPDLPLVAIDAVLIERVLVNLLDNAARHGAGTIALRASRGRDAVEIAVEDDGPGLALDRSRLFEPFDAADGDRHGAARIGLAICRAIVESHGGTIRAEDRDAGGTRFVVALPVAPVPASLEAAIAPAGST